MNNPVTALSSAVVNVLILLAVVVGMETAIAVVVVSERRVTGTA